MIHVMSGIKVKQRAERLEEEKEVVIADLLEWKTTKIWKSKQKRYSRI